MRRRFATTLTGLLLSLATAQAQDLEPRSYANLPIGMNFLVAGYNYSEGGVAFDPSLPIEDAKLHIHGTAVGYARSVALWGKSARIDVVAPYAWLSGSAQVQGARKDRDVNGFADPRLRFSINLYGAPAMDLEEFSHYKPDVVIGASLLVSPPLGQYDSDKAVNLGTNRWAIRPEVGVSKTWGPLSVDAASSITFYTNNDNFYGDTHRSQEPIYALQGHIIYSIWRGVWLALDGTIYGGGRTTVDGASGDDQQANTRAGATLSFPLSRYHSIKVYYSTGTSTRTGSSFDTVGLLFQVRWGAGL